MHNSGSNNKIITVSNLSPLQCNKNKDKQITRVFQEHMTLCLMLMQTIHKMCEGQTKRQMKNRQQ